MKTTMMRMFVALPLSDPLHLRLAEIQKQLRRRCPEGSVRWVNPDDIHLTLFFIGDALSTRVASIQEALSVVARNAPAFELEVKGLGAFPNARRPRVIWVGLAEPTGRLALLHRAVNEALAQVGFKPDERPFHPHLTLGRVGRRTFKEDLQHIEKVLGSTEVGTLGISEATQLVLFQSVLGPSGAHYTPLKRFPLGSA